MLGFIKSLITNDNLSEQPSEFDRDTQLKIATCALMLEVANSDDEFVVEEKSFITKTMKEEFNLDDKLVSELLSISKEKVKQSVSLYEFTDIINKNYSKDEKLTILDNLWKLVYADGTLDKYEEYFIRTISKNLHLNHTDMIASKLEIQSQRNN
jgi:uncharacterized tellurite resistance protein B-like protein